MGRADWYKHGDHNAICDICGFKYKASELKRTWEGYYVCERDFEHRHPQDFVRGKKDDQSVPWSRTESGDTFISLTCGTRTAVCGEAVAGCAIAGSDNFSGV